MYVSKLKILIVYKNWTILNFKEQIKMYTAIEIWNFNFLAISKS